MHVQLHPPEACVCHDGVSEARKTKTNIEGRDGLKRGELELFADLNGDLARKQ